MPYRYDARSLTKISKNDMPKQIKNLRKLEEVSLFSSPSYSKIDLREIGNMGYEIHVWGKGDRYDNISDMYYDDSRYWWVIAMFNNTPTEHHVSLGDRLIIPDDPETISELMKVR